MSSPKGPKNRHFARHNDILLDIMMKKGDIIPEKEAKMLNFIDSAAFGKFANQKRKRANLSQNSVATALGLPNRSQICRRERGQTEWSLNEVLALANLLDLKMSDLFREFEESGQ